MSKQAVPTWAIIVIAITIALIVAIMIFGLPVPTKASAAPALIACPSGEVITVVAPSASAPTTVSVTVAPPVNLKPAKDAVADSFHLHYFVDIDPSTVVQAGQPVPTGNPKIIHSAATTQDVGALSPGKHTVSVVLGDVSHTVCSPIVQGSVSFDVSATAALPATGSGGTASPPSRERWLVAALMAGLVTLAAGWSRRRSSANERAK